MHVEIKGVGHVRSEDSYITIIDRFGANFVQTFPSIQISGKILILQKNNF